MPVDILRLSKSVKRITLLQKDDLGDLTPVVLYESGRKKKKKGTRTLRPLERLVRSFVDADDAARGAYARRHKNSNRKSRDGWALDMPTNVLRATRDGFKKVNPVRLFGL